MRKTALVNQVVSDGQARYSDQRASFGLGAACHGLRDYKTIRLSDESGWYRGACADGVAVSKHSFVPDVDEGIFVFACHCYVKEARMNIKTNFRIEAISCLLVRLLERLQF